VKVGRKADEEFLNTQGKTGGGGGFGGGGKEQTRWGRKPKQSFNGLRIAEHLQRLK